MRASLPLLAILLTASTGAAQHRPAAQASAPGDTAGALAAQRDWWRAFVLADTAYLRAHTAPGFSLTLSSGRTFDAPGMLAEAATHTQGSRLELSWGDETIRLVAPTAAAAAVRATEADGQTASAYRYLTVLQRHGGGWRVAVAQSTRELVFTPRVPAAAAGALADYAGDYRLPRGGVLRVLARDSALVLVEPSGAELPMEPVGPGLFEFKVLSPSNGVVRFSFGRDAAGRVSTLSRLVPGFVNTWPRVP